MMTTTEASRTLVTFLLDRTGSMASIADDTIGGFNTYLAGLKESTTPIDFTFLQFDSMSLDKLCVAMPVRDVQPLTRKTFVPRANTPLIDAAYKTVKAVEMSIVALSDKPKIIICFQTDGEENASTEYTWDQLNALIKEKHEQGWEFNFMGASIDAYKHSARMGISAGSTMSYNSRDTVSTKRAFAASAQNTRGFSEGVLRSTAYSGAQRKAAGDTFAAPDLMTLPEDVKADKQSAKAAEPQSEPKPKPIVDDITL